MGRYAVTSSVPVDRTKAEIEKILAKYGAVGFMYGTDGKKATVAFKMNNKMIRFDLPLPACNNYSTDQKWAQAMRSCWRSLLLLIKAKLEGVESGIITFETEFLPYVVLPNKQTVAEFLGPQIEAAYIAHSMPPLLPWEDKERA